MVTMSAGWNLKVVPVTGVMGDLDRVWLAGGFSRAACPPVPTLASPTPAAGLFEVKRRKPRRARNPKTGEEVLVRERSVVRFKPGQIMQQRVEAVGNHNQGAAELAKPTMNQVDS